MSATNNLRLQVLVAAASESTFDKFMEGYPNQKAVNITGCKTIGDGAFVYTIETDTVAELVQFAQGCAKELEMT